MPVRAVEYLQLGSLFSFLLVKLPIYDYLCAE